MSLGERNIKIAMVSCEPSIISFGFRGIVSVARAIVPSTQVFFLPFDNFYSMLNIVHPPSRTNDSGKLDDRCYYYIADVLSKYDLVCFSLLSSTNFYTKHIVQRLREITNQQVYVMGGGVHCILNPEDSIKYFDAICVGEGEICFEKFLKAFINGKEYVQTENMWFNFKGKIVRNRRMELLKNDFLSTLRHRYIGMDCFVFDFFKRKFCRFSKYIYTKHFGLSYRTIWTLGCPYSCSYCENDEFLHLDRNYAKIRYPSSQFIINEIKEAQKIHPYITNIAFYDDNLIAIDLESLRIFSDQYKKEINLPFTVYGVHPNTIDEKKLELLADAGCNRVRMGIQSANERVLTLFNRNTGINKIKDSVAIISRMTKKYKMIPPTYDIITDIPFETKQEIIESLKFINDLDRPFFLAISGLRIFPNTKLGQYFEKIQLSKEALKYINCSSFQLLRPTLSNCLWYVISVFKVPKPVLKIFFKHIKDYNSSQKLYSLAIFFLRILYLAKHSFEHIKKMNFSIIGGKWTYFLWRFKVVRNKKN
ncbi:MAG: radical SAM protein [Endomicrobium sp.]|nr:radical SAM protein [Endomicrobium sp.]